jgi:two-component system, LytTR family, sensor kinase
VDRPPSAALFDRFGAGRSHRPQVLAYCSRTDSSAGPPMALVATPYKRTFHILAATLAFVWLGCAVYVLLEQVAGSLTLRDFSVDPLRRLRALTLDYWLPWVAFAPLVALCSHRFPIRPNRWFAPVGVHLLLLLGIALLHGLGIGYIYHYSDQVTPQMATFEPWQHSGHFLFGDSMLLFDTVSHAVFVASLNIRNFHSIVRQQELDASRLNHQLAELRFQTLRMQIDPHFLFNALNAISVLIRKGEAAHADEMIRRLSRFFRRTLESSSSHCVPLEDELEMVRQYIAIVKVRFGERLRVVEECEAGVLCDTVPAMLLQPLVENAVTHGLAEKVGPCELALRCRRSGDRLRIEIEDDGVGGRFHADPSFSEGIGLANVRARLQQMYGARHLFDLESSPGRGTRIAIELPLAPALAEPAA